jgi:hypothetical protein
MSLESQGVPRPPALQSGTIEFANEVPGGQMDTKMSKYNQQDTKHQGARSVPTALSEGYAQEKEYPLYYIEYLDYKYCVENESC